MAVKTCYLMIKDVEGQEVGLEWGVNYDLGEGEELPTDIEELTEAQYAIYRMSLALQGTFEEAKKAELAEQAKDKPSGLVLPR